MLVSFVASVVLMQQASKPAAFLPLLTLILDVVLEVLRIAEGRLLLFVLRVVHHIHRVLHLTAIPRRIFFAYNGAKNGKSERLTVLGRCGTMCDYGKNGRGDGNGTPEPVRKEPDMLRNLKAVTHMDQTHMKHAHVVHLIQACIDQ